ncbi:MAG TPA: LD-carboxypeptidase [Bacteroidales bacterium]|nr:LD-carboxypeptidase [Bacteroidales bacterium]
MQKKIVRPPDLKPGDLIGIVAPARKVSREEMAPAISMIKQWGYGVVEGQHLYGENNQFSGTDQERSADMQCMLDDDAVRAIFCARGGYGSVRIIDKIDFSGFRNHPKWIVGYSDITVFHSHIHTQLGIQTLHAPMPINFGNEFNMASGIESLKNILSGQNPEYIIEPHPYNIAGEARGPVVGGNLSMLYSLIGSASDIDTDGKILFLEDLDEYLYHVDRMMMNLKRSGKLERLAGMVIGGMNDMNDNTVPFGRNAYEIIREIISDYNFPVIFGFKSGHIPENLGLILGGHARLKVDGECSLRFF